MKLTRDRIGALFFLCAAVGYYLMAGSIELYPGDEYEPINAQTFPKVIGAVGAILSLLIIVLPGKGDEAPVGWAGNDGTPDLAAQRWNAETTPSPHQRERSRSSCP